MVGLCSVVSKEILFNIMESDVRTASSMAYQSNTKMSYVCVVQWSSKQHMAHVMEVLRDGSQNEWPEKRCWSGAGGSKDRTRKRRWTLRQGSKENLRPV